jgi:prophage regulatory protein
VINKAMRLPAVLDATGWTKNTLYYKISKGIFPKGTKIDPNGKTVVWFEDEVAAFQAAARTAREAKQPMPPNEKGCLITKLAGLGSNEEAR